jgi:hypothetical protein
MMNVRNFLIVIISVTASLSSLAQSNLLNAKYLKKLKKLLLNLSQINDKPLAYGYVHDRDVLMGKMTWEIIDLSGKDQFSIVLPLIRKHCSDRRSLYDVLTQQFVTDISEVYSDSYFNTKKSFKDIQASLTRN